MLRSRLLGWISLSRNFVSPRPDGGYRPGSRPRLSLASRAYAEPGAVSATLRNVTSGSQGLPLLSLSALQGAAAPTGVVIAAASATKLSLQTEQLKGTHENVCVLTFKPEMTALVIG